MAHKDKVRRSEYHAKNYAKNRDVIRAAQRAWWHSPSGASHRWRKTLRKHGLTQTQWDAIWTAQEDTCAGCREGLVQSAPSTHIDHCHKTGKVRGILCAACNLAIGKIKDCPETLRRLAEYLDISKREGGQNRGTHQNY